MVSKLGFHIQRRPTGWPNGVADALPALVKSLAWRIADRRAHADDPFGLRDASFGEEGRRRWPFRR
ncbi:MAG: hypothetical protein FJZ90_05605 [Chloroflexi bacterium]|nr:hypothetical protein [Chloroflexota bacterium]